MLTNDLINGCFEFVGGFCTWLNVRQLYRDQEVKGVDWRTTLFWWSWGTWNVYYYPSLNQWFSFIGGVWLAVGNCVWLLLLLWILKKESIKKFLLAPARVEKVK